MFPSKVKDQPFVKRRSSHPYGYADASSDGSCHAGVLPIDIRVVLCVSTATACHPEWIGLSGESLGMQRWLHVCCDADEVRRIVARGWRGEFWVAGSDSVNGINLAATLKRDAYDATVKLIDFEASGSLCSRAATAGIDAVFDKTEFVQAYVSEKSMAQAFPSQAFPCQEDDDTQSQPRGSYEEPEEARADSAGYAGSSVETMGHLGERATSERMRHANDRLGSKRHNVARRRGSLICVVGAGGGVGKSTVSTLLACVMQSAGKHVAVLDADFQFGDLHYLFGEERPVRSDDLVRMPERFDALEADGSSPLLVAAPVHLENSEIASEHLLELVDGLCARFDVVVVNTGAMWVDTHIKLLGESALSLFIIDQRPSSIRTCRRALDLCARCGVASQSFLFAANRCSRNALFTSIDVSCAMNGVHAVEIKDGGKDVEEILGLGRPYDLIRSKNPLATSLYEMAQSEFPPTLKIEPGVERTKRREGTRQARHGKRRTLRKGRKKTRSRRRIPKGRRL